MTFTKRLHKWQGIPIEEASAEEILVVFLYFTAK